MYLLFFFFSSVLWEILTREEPFAEYTNFDKFKEAVVVRHERPPIPEDTIPSLKNLIKQCWDKDPNARPTFEKIITDLDAIIVESAIADPNARTFWKKYFLKEVCLEHFFFLSIHFYINLFSIQFNK